MALHMFELIFCVSMLVLSLYHSLTFTNDASTIDDFVEKTIDCRKIPGMIVSVVKDNRVVHTKGYGKRDLTTGEPATEETLFQIASLTKAFTATLLMDLVSSSKYSSNTKLKDIFPEFVIDGSYERSKYATVEDLLSHRMGIPDNNKIRFDPNLTRADVIRRIKYFKAKGTFRDSFYYSNLFYGVLSHLIEYLGNNTYEKIMTSKLFKPLGMDSSNFATTADYSALDVATGYVHMNGQFSAISHEFSRHWATLVGSGGILSNAKDMARWLLFHLEGGKNMKGTQVVDKDVLSLTYKHHLAISSASKNKYFTKPTVPASTTEDSYAMGWKRGYYRGYRMLTHTGSTAGFVSMLTLLPDKNIGIFTGMSGSDKNYIYRTLLHNFIADVYLGETPWVNETIGCTYPNAGAQLRKNITPRVRRAPLIRALADYIGTYYNPGYGNMYVFRNISNTVGLGLKYGIAKYDLKPLGSDKFYGDTYGLAYFWKVKEFLFSMSDASVGRMDTITVPAYEKNFPPVFRLKSNEDPTAQIIG